MKRLLYVLIVVLAVLLGIWLGKDSSKTSSSETQANDPALSASLPKPDPTAGLTPSTLDALLKPDLTPQQQTDIIGQLLLDYYSTTHTLPNGTWEEICAQLSGQNKAKLAIVPSGHPALGKSGFQSDTESPGIVLHVISSSQAVFDLIHTGPDKLPFTEDDLIRPFPPK
jgi:hypothetical protein